MDFITFYKEIDSLLRTHKSSFSDKFKMDSSDLVKAVRDNDAAQVALVLNAWVNPNREDGLGRFALPIAVENNNPIIVGLLLRKKAEPNILGDDGQSPLFKAVYWENAAIVELLLNDDATVSFANNDGKTPLQEAINNGYEKIVDLLQNFKSEKRKSRISKEQATHDRLRIKAEEARQKRQEVAEKAIIDEKERAKAEAVEQEKNVLQKYDTTKDKPLRSLLQAMVKKDNEAVKYFIEQVSDINEIDAHFHNTPLLMAVDLEKGKLAKFLIKKGASPILTVNGQYSPLTKAIRMELYSLVKFMLEHLDNSSETLNAPHQLWSPQFLAYKDAKMLNLLLDAGADPHFGGKEGISPIKKAIEKASIAVLPALMRHKVNVDQTTDGKRLLEWAVIYNRTDWVNGLLGEHAEDDFITSDGKSLIELAEELGEREAIVALLST